MSIPTWPESMTSNQTGYQKSVSQQLFNICVLFLDQSGMGVLDILGLESLTVDAMRHYLL